MMIVKKDVDFKPNFNRFVSFFDAKKTRKMAHYNFVLSDFKCGSIVVVTENHFKQLLRYKPFYWRSIICKQIVSLVAKNNLLEQVDKLKINKPFLAVELKYFFIDKFIYYFINLLRVKLRNEHNKIYSYQVVLIEEFLGLTKFKLQYQAYCQSLGTNVSFSSMLASYEGRHFEAYATPRQQRIVDMLYRIIDIPAENLLTIFDLVSDEIRECAELSEAQSDYGKLNGLRAYITSILHKTTKFTDCVAEKKLDEDQTQKILSLILEQK